jgi:peptide/nickel transport system permease protein
VTIAHVLRMVRTSVIEVMQILAQMAILRGVPYWRMVFRHAAERAPATISLMALQIAWLLGGVVVIEARSIIPAWDD